MSKYNIRNIFAEMELDLIKSMQRNLKRHEDEEEEMGFEWEQWQQRKLQDLQKYRKEARQIVKKATPEVEQAVDTGIKGAFRRGVERVRSLWDKITGKKPKVEAEDGSDSSFFKINEERVKALTKASQNDLKKARHAMLRQADDVFRQTIYKAQVYMNSGAASLSQAVDMATKDFLDKGFDCIEFSNGRRMNVASYAEMALRTSSQRAVFAGEGAKRDQLGIRTVVISSHNNCSELCLPYQGKVFIDDVYSKGTKKDGKYPLLSTAIANGLFHPNCRHNMTTFVPGKSRLPQPVDDDEALANYEAEQQQRYMERQIRKYKRREAGSVDPVNQEAAKAKVKEWQARLRYHLKENDQLRRDRNRERNRLPVEVKEENGLNNGNKPLSIQSEIVTHASRGEFTNPKNPKKQAIGKFKSGGHGQENIDLLDQNGISYNVVREYKNGVRIGNVPEHKEKIKQTGTKQSWFPKHWTAQDIEKAGQTVANLQDPSLFHLEPKKANDQLIAIFKYGNYKGVTVGVVYDVKKKGITTIFPDETQRLIGDDDK